MAWTSSCSWGEGASEGGLVNIKEWTRKTEGYSERPLNIEEDNYGEGSLGACWHLPTTLLCPLCLLN